MTEHGQPPRPTGGEPGAAGSGSAASTGSVVNTGLSITGSTVSAGVIAGGQDARVTVNQVGAADDRMAQIERLVQQLQAAASRLEGEQAEQVYDDADRLLAEEKQRKPDRERIAHLMSRIAQAAGPIASLVDIVAQLKGLI